MVVVQASKLSLSPSSSSSSASSSSSSAAPTSLLFEPTSQSLALTHPDSSLSLFPSLTSLLSLSSLPPPQTLIQPPSSSSIFLLLQQNPNSTPIVLFIVSGPHRGGSQILLRFYALQRGSTAKFTRPKVVCKQKGLTFEPNSGVSVDNHHGFSVKLSGSVNLFSMYSISSSKVWVYGVRTAGDERASEDGLVVKLMKYAVIESCRPVWSICVAFGLAVFGEENGVRVFDLRLLGKGHSKKVKNMTSNSKNGFRGPRLPNGVISESTTGHSENACDCHLEGKIDKHCGSRAETVWVSDGHYSVHVINGCDIDAANGEKDGNDIEEKLRQISVGQAIFTSEKIQALVPLSSHGTLILGQGSIYVYTIS
ncbi:uncharacterized protein LOC116204789 isoform X4 [Punica granatum]|uniref:Uncharacterized protein LOC116204789 isoform X4 n=1 Tax=Punica granatum TaxID=22663 RepID=A0A6P8D753_PUNGR|nr:uncharacterized protein LOC116204789 isoform X4 [Punica granatum]